MLDGLTTSQQMFMLFFSILYGIMLNSLMGLAAFPIAHAFAGEDVTGADWNDEPVYRRGKKSRKRFVLSFMLLNVIPFIYFAIFFQFLSSIGTAPTVSQILFIALLSLSVFAFPQFFLSCITHRRLGNHLYTEYGLKRVVNKKGFHPKPKYHVFAGIFYLAIPWLVFFIVCFLNRLVEVAW